MGSSDQENAGVKDFMGIGRDTASCAEARKHVYARSHNYMRGESKHIYMDKQPMYNVDPPVSSQHYADAIAVVKSNILDAVHQWPTASRWLYNNNSRLANAAMGRPDWNNPGGRQQFFSFNISREQRGVEKVNDAYQIMHARGHGNALNCNLPAKCIPDPSGLGIKVFPSVAPVLHEQASTVRVHQVPIATNSRALTAPLLVGGGPSTRMQPADSSTKSSSTQLTIFYAGKVNVYNDVNSIKAQEIMLMAASGSSLPSSNMDMYSGTSIQMVTPLLSGSLKNADPPELSRIDPSTCQPEQLARDQVGISAFSASTPQAPQADESCMPGTESTYLDNESSFPRALPQARKASLARFLERRKERVLSKSPYPVEKTFL